MRYELLKELKDEEFPMKGNEWDISECTDGTAYFIEGTAPTLEELIEACEMFIVRFSLEKHSNDWRCGDYSSTKIGDFASGQTKKDAVGRLWLKLKKENHETKIRRN